MKRRAYLAVVGMGSIAGCLGGDDEEADDSDEATDDRELPPVEADDADSESVVESDDEPAEEDDSRDPSDEVELERAIKRAEDQYRLAMDEFASHVDGEDPTFIDVLPSTDLEFNNAREHLNAAREILWNDAREFAHTEAEQQRVREYRTYDDLITKLYRIQRSIHRTYSRIEHPESGQTYSSIPSSLTSGTDDHTALGEEMADKKVYMDELQAKFDQQAWQLKLLERTFSGLVNVRSPRQISGRSTTQLQFARDEFRTVIVELTDPSSALPTDRTDDALLELVEQWHTLVDETLQSKSTQIE